MNDLGLSVLVLDIVRAIAVVAGVVAAGLWFALFVANIPRVRASNGTGGLARIVSMISFSVIGLIVFGLGRLVELIWTDSPLQLVGGPTLLFLYGLMDIALIQALLKSHLYAKMKASGAVSKEAILALKKQADAEHEDLQFQIDQIVKRLEGVP